MIFSVMYLSYRRVSQMSSRLLYIFAAKMPKIPPHKFREDNGSCTKRTSTNISRYMRCDIKHCTEEALYNRPKALSSPKDDLSRQYWSDKRCLTRYQKITLG